MVWVKHPIYNIEVADSGECRWNKPRKTRLDRYGYLRLNVAHQGQVKTVLVHNLVADVFLGRRQTGMTVNHKNGVKTDNRVENLEYVTAGENTTHAFTTGLVGTCRQVVFGGQTYYSMRECERKTGVPRRLLREEANP